jgi:hypothetical protein
MRLLLWLHTASIARRRRKEKQTCQVSRRATPRCRIAHVGSCGAPAAPLAVRCSDELCAHAVQDFLYLHVPSHPKNDLRTYSLPNVLLERLLCSALRLLQFCHQAPHYLSFSIEDRGHVFSHGIIIHNCHTEHPDRKRYGRRGVMRLNQKFWGCATGSQSHIDEML